MKKLIYTIFFLSIFISAVSFSQIPSYTLEVKNGNFVNANTFTFDIVFTHTDANVWETASWQYFFRVDNAFFGGGTVTYAYDSSGGDAISDLPVAFRPRNPQSVVQTTYRELRLPANSLPGTGNGLIVPQGVPTLIGRMKLTSTNPLVFASFNFIIRDSCESPISVTRTKINIYDQSDLLNKEVTRCANHTVNLNFPITLPPVADFNSNFQLIESGQSIDFFDASSNTPTSWQWTFPGGSPSSSTLKNPSGIVYNTPGVYNVFLRASNSFGFDTLTKVNYISVQSILNSCPITWKSKIIATDAANKKDTVMIGMSPFGSYGIDTCLGEYLLPPPPPAGAFDFRLILPPTYTLDATKFDFRKDTLSSSVYWMNFQTSVSGPIVFSWNPSSFPTTGQFFLREDIMGTNINMKSQNSFVLNNPGIRFLRIDYEFRATYPISINNGWNLISVPLQAFDMSVSSLFEFDVTTAFSYNNGYINVPTLFNGTGYWINFPNARSYDISGIIRYNKIINATEGWNMIGPYEEEIPVNKIITIPNSILISDFFGYNNGYFSEDTLKPGKGYWIKTSGPGIIMKDTNDSFVSLPVTEQKNNLNEKFTIEFSDLNQNVFNLYLVNKNELTSQFELPPVPPVGIFDVRFINDKFVESFGKTNSIKINSADRPLKIIAHNLFNKKIRLKDNLGGSVINKLLKENEEILLTSSVDNLMLVDETSVPVSYGIDQNYPNPFNPSTKINYRIPQDDKVRIIVYDILGREILKLVDEQQQAGRYEISFNAFNLSSGIYFYKFESGDFKDLKKMILLK